MIIIILASIFIGLSIGIGTFILYDILKNKCNNN